MRGYRLFVVSAIVVLLAACGGGSGSNDRTSPPPIPSYSYQVPASLGDGWTTSNADSQGLSVQRLEDMMEAIGRGEYPIIDSIAIASRGSLVFEETIRTQLDEKDGWVANNDLSRHAQLSVSKSIVSILVGIAVDQGYFGGVDVPYLGLFDYASYDNWDERKNQITLHHVLAMRLGLEWDEWSTPYGTPDNPVTRFFREQHDFSKGLLDLPLAADPGSAFAYNTIASISLGQAIQNRNPLALVDFLATHLLDPLNITTAGWVDTPSGLPDLGGGLFLRTRDVAKFGQLYLDDGNWNGQQVVSADWVAASIQAYTELRWSDPESRDWQVDGYGYQWWTGYFEHQGRRLDTFVALGWGQQTVMVIPELDLVIAINCNDYDDNPGADNQVFGLIARFILPSG
ncbi:MAG: serine hydrolase [Woeseiaceae bacterium]|nr:serine hydrolase [Woeseiaceae bacterium]NIP19956.1 serine hydrolase [Woeseiaceae bacterium]NIS88752.1 serine hydrolase [Woeseiaceae bacterium]